MFESPWRLLLGLVTGIVVGVVLQKAGAAKHGVVLGQLLLRDWTVAKILGAAVAVGSVGVHAMIALGWTELWIAPARIGGVLAGAALFGVGLAILGHCPGTALVAIGEGRRDALAGLAGMVAGAGAYVLGYRQVERVQNAVADRGRITLAELTETPAWVWVVGIAAVVLLAYSASRVAGSGPGGDGGVSIPVGGRG